MYLVKLQDVVYKPKTESYTKVQNTIYISDDVINYLYSRIRQLRSLVLLVMNGLMIKLIPCAQQDVQEILLQSLLLLEILHGRTRIFANLV